MTSAEWMDPDIKIMEICHYAGCVYGVCVCLRVCVNECAQKYIFIIEISLYTKQGEILVNRVIIKLAINFNLKVFTYIYTHTHNTQTHVYTP